MGWERLRTPWRRKKLRQALLRGQDDLTSSWEGMGSLQLLGGQAGPCVGWAARGLGWLVSGHTVGGKKGGHDAARRDEGLATPNLTCPQAREVPGVKVFRSSVTMYFANAELYSDSLKQRVRPGVCGVRARGRGSLLSCSLHIPCPVLCCSAVWMWTTSSLRRRSCFGSKT